MHLMPMNLQPIGVGDTRHCSFRHIGVAEAEHTIFAPVPIFVEEGFGYGELPIIAISVHDQPAFVEVVVNHIGEFTQCSQCSFSIHISISFLFVLSCVFIPYEPLAALIQLTE